MKTTDLEVRLIKELNKRHAVINLSGSFRILTPLKDPITGYPSVNFSSLQDMKYFYRNQLIQAIDENGKTKQINPVDIWINSKDRRFYKGRVFIPGDTPEGYYNFWHGFDITPKKGKCFLYLQHIEENICRGDSELYPWILDWMADAIQNPEERPGTAIVLRGKQGTGKGVFLSNFGRLFGPHFVHVTGQQRLTGKFNFHLSNALFTFVDEGFWAGDKRDIGNLKAIITEEWITIEPKFQDAYQQKNYNRVAMASNSRWVVPAGLEERRFLVLDVGEDRMQDSKYFGAIIDQMKSGGYEALMYFLSNRKITSDLRTIPRTQALFEQMVSSMDSVKRWWLTCLMNEKIVDDDEFWPESKTVNETYKSYSQQATSEGERHRASKVQFGQQIKKLHPEIYKRRISWGDGRRWCYVFPELLECQNHFESQVGIPIDWGG